VTSNGFGIQVPGFSVGRFPGANAGTPLVLTYPTPCGGTVPCETNRPYTNFGSQFTLKINEWVCTNDMGADWLEVFNPDTNIVELGGLVLTDTNVGRVGFIRAVPDRSYIAGKSFIRFWCDKLASKDADHLDFSLTSCSDCSAPPANGVLDHIYLFAPDRSTLIDHVLVSAQLFRRPGYSQGRIPDGETNLFIFSNPTPEKSNIAPIPEININELLAHVDPPLEDAVELQNVTSTNVDISYWWLTDDQFTPKKYRIAAGTIIPPGKFKVFYESNSFNCTGLNPNITCEGTALIPFNFNSAHGGECYLFKGDAAGNVLGFRKGVTFGASRNGVSFGRYVTSDGNVEFIPMCDLSLGTSVRAGDDPGLQTYFRTGEGATNPPPCSGTIVINEIHYKPINTAVLPGGPLVVDDTDHEYVELRNISANSEALYYVPRDQGEQDDRFQTNGWRIDGVIGFDFPPGTDVAPGIILAPDEYILLVNFDPATNSPAFITQWRNFFNPPVPNSVRLFGPYKRKLSNSEGSVQLLRPDAPQRPPHPDAGFVPYVLVERVQYQDRSPWPTNPANGLKIDGCRRLGVTIPPTAWNCPTRSINPTTSMAHPACRFNSGSIAAVPPPSPISGIATGRPFPARSDRNISSPPAGRAWAAIPVSPAIPPATPPAASPSSPSTALSHSPRMSPPSAQAEEQPTSPSPAQTAAPGRSAASPLGSLTPRRRTSSTAQLRLASRSRLGPARPCALRRWTSRASPSPCCKARQTTSPPPSVSPNLKSVRASRPPVFARSARPSTRSALPAWKSRSAPARS
jgi:hypothetical protein